MHGNTSVNHRRRIHYFTQSQNSRMFQISFHFSCCKNTPVIIHMSRRNTGRHHHIYIRRCIFCLIQDIINSIRTGYICRLMRIYNKCCSSTLCSLPDQLTRRHQSRFQMQMTVDKSRTDYFSFQINLCLSFVCTDSDHNSICNSHITINKFSCTRAEHTPIFKHQLSLLNTSCHLRIPAIHLKFHKKTSLHTLESPPAPHIHYYSKASNILSYLLVFSDFFIVPIIFFYIFHYILSSVFLICNLFFLYQSNFPSTFNGFTKRLLDISCSLFISLTSLYLHHIIFDHIMISEYFLDHSSLNSFQKRFLQHIQWSRKFDLQWRFSIHQLHTAIQ